LPGDESGSNEHASEPWIAAGRVSVPEGGEAAAEEDLNAFLAHIDGTRLSDLIEFGRAVHAEMEAVLSAARRGVPTQNATLACTNSPCHNCMRHLIAAGIRRVIYMIPYTKSLALELHGDAVVFEPEDPDAVPRSKLSLEQFVGVAPRGFAQYFDFSRIDRKDDVSGQAKKLEDRRATTARVLRDYDAWSFGGPALHAGYVTRLEQDVASALVETLARKQLTIPTEMEEGGSA
jgi:deoxycytidylate deaminase